MGIEKLSDFVYSKTKRNKSLIKKSDKKVQKKEKKYLKTNKKYDILKSPKEKKIFKSIKKV